MKQTPFKHRNATSNPEFTQHYIVKMFSGLSLQMDTKYLSVHQNSSKSLPRSNLQSNGSEKQVTLHETSDADQLKLRNERSGKLKLGNLESPDIIDLTGYKVGNDYHIPQIESETDKHNVIEKSNVSRGSGKISQALGKL